MKVLFAGKTTKKLHEITRYKMIEDAILVAGHTLCLPVDQFTLHEGVGDYQGALGADDWATLAKRQLAAAYDCDVAIFDVTDKANDVSISKVGLIGERK